MKKAVKFLTSELFPVRAGDGEKVGHVARVSRIAWFMLIMLSTLIIIVPHIALGEIYQWTNADGTIGVTDDPAKVPLQYREQAQKKREDDTSSDGGVYYSKPAEREPASSGIMTHDNPDREPEKKMTEEEKKKEEEKIRAVWENMKKGLRGY